MADNPGIPLQLFGNRELEDSTYTRPGTILPSFVPPVIGFHKEDTFEDSGNEGQPKGRAKSVNNLPYKGGQSNPGILVEGFYDLFWKDRLHIIEDSFEAGNILSSITNGLEIYNSGTVLGKDNHRIISLNSLVGLGITISSGNTSFPVEVGLGESELYEYLIDLNGPASINDAYDFTMSNGVVLSHSITGSRVFLLVDPPQERYFERWQWLTDVIEKADGSEQRVSVRDIPRQQIVHNYVYGDEFKNVKLENAIYDRMPELIAIPLHRDVIQLSANVLAGDLILPVSADPTARQFRNGESVVVFNVSTETFEVNNIASRTASTIVLNSPLLSGWSAGDEVKPVLLSYVDGVQRQQLERVNARGLELVFNVQENEDTPDESSFPVYQSLPVYDLPLIVESGDYSREFDFGVDRIDLRLGKTHQSSLQTSPRIKMASFIAEYKTRAEFDIIKGFLMARRGKAKSFWLSTSRDDIFPDNTNSAPTTVVESKIVGYAAVFARGARKHIQIDYTDGSIDRREVTDVTTIPNFEQITLDSNISQDWSPANVRRVSHLVKVCLDVDTLEFVQEWPVNGFVRFTLREVQD